MKPVITSNKHIIQRSLLVIQEQSQANTLIARAKDMQDVANVTDVVTGSVIKAVWLEYWLMGEGAQPCTATWSFEKLPNDATAMTQTQGQNLNSYPNKKNLFKIGQGLIGDSNTNPIPIVREWIKIPKGKQRMGLGDELIFNVSIIGEASNGGELCGFALYKEYT